MKNEKRLHRVVEADGPALRELERMKGRCPSGKAVGLNESQWGKMQGSWPSRKRVHVRCFKLKSDRFFYCMVKAVGPQRSNGGREMHLTV